MLEFIKGTVETIDESSAVIACGGLGYLLQCTAGAISVAAKGGEVKLYVYLHVKEDAIALYGFENIDEKNMFLKLIGISGIGPKAAISILSGLDYKSLAMAIVNGDSGMLSKIKGVGKKTAERVILELREKMGQAATFAHAGSVQMESSGYSDALAALTSLGFSIQTAQTALSGIDRSLSAEEMIGAALKNMDRKG